MSRPRLLYLVTEDWYFCSHRLPLAIAAHDAGFEVTVLTRVRDHGDIIRQAGLKLIPFEISRMGTNPFSELATLARLVAVYRSERPNIVHHVAMKPILYGTLAARLTRVPNIINALAGMGWLFTSSNAKAKFMQSLVRLAYRILLRPTSLIVQNPDDAKLMVNLGLRRIHIIRGSGVDTKIFRPKPEPAGLPLVVLPARMLWDKGVGEFVAMAKLLKATGVAARFALVGAPDPGNPAAVPTDQLTAWQDEGGVEWWWQRNDMPQVYEQAQIVCLPSYREGLPKSLLEAAACGLPIVTTDVPGCREIVRDGDNGFLVPIRNAAALADAIAKLLMDPVLRRRMGERGRQRVLEEFSQEQVIRETLALYREQVA